MSVLFEHQLSNPIAAKDDLRRLLHETWASSPFQEYFRSEDDSPRDEYYQPYVRFEGDRIKARDYIGFIQHGDLLIEIYPKVFRELDQIEENRTLMNRHVFHWLDYCNKWRFPFKKANLDSFDAETLPELLINLIANRFKNSVAERPLLMYQEVEEALAFPKGTIDFDGYLRNNFSRGHFHKIDCVHEPFLYDNLVNRILKYCTRLLLGRTEIPENQRVLHEILFIMEDVTDRVCTPEDIERVKLNQFFEDYAELMSACSLILNQQLYSSGVYELSQWCLLLPMNYIFEDFLAGFIREKFGGRWNVEYQKSEMFLTDEPEAFRMQHDIYITSREDGGGKVIVDAKYKIRPDGYKSTAKRGVAQGDMYQMVSYAFKRGCTDLVLLYPNKSGELEEPDSFEIRSGFPGSPRLRVLVLEVPFWSGNGPEMIDKELYQVINDSFSSLGLD